MRRWIFLAAVFTIFAVDFGWTSWTRAGGRSDVPPPPGDTHDYDSIAVQLTRGRGFYEDYGDAEFRRPYIAANTDGRYDALLTRHWREAATNRPLLLPLVVAVTYRLFGRNFLAWQMVNTLITALGLTIVCAAAWRAFGWRVAFLSAAVMFVSSSYVFQVADLMMMSETLAILFIALLLLTLPRLSTGRLMIAAMCGAFTALLILAKVVFILALPFLISIAAWLAPRRRAIAVAATVLAVAVALQLPFWIRNCLVLHAFLPLGTQGASGLYAAYSDSAFEHLKWWNPSREEMQRAFVRELGKPCSASDDRTLALCLPKGAAIWIARHPLKVPLLAWQKLRATFVSIDEAGRAWPLFIASLAAPFVLRRRREFVDMPTTYVLAGFVALDLLAIALTWTVGWRFIVPVEPLLSVAAALTFAAMLFGDRAIASEP